MSDGVTRTTVSIDGDVYLLAKKRMRALRIRKFSRYVELLLEKDVRERGPLTVVKEEDPEYRAKVLRVGAHIPSGHPKRSKD